VAGAPAGKACQASLRQLSISTAPIAALSGPEGDTIKFVEHCFVEALTDAIGLWALGLGAGVIDVLDCKIELVLVMFGIAAIFRPAVGQHA
jgi:hypothetical protein